MANVEIVKVDQGGANARILAREAKVDFRRVEAASLKIATRFSSAEGKRMFVRMFNTLQLNMHFISVIARTRLDHEDIGRIETALRGRIDAATTSLNEAIDGAEALFKAHGITSLASYDTVPLDVDVRVLSSISRRFLEVLVKLDQLMPLLQTLEIPVAKILHGEQSFCYHLPACAGDRITVRSKVDDIYDKKNGALEFVVKSSRATNQNNELVAEMRSVIVVRN